jgi:beta-lactamase regulating signal transducer with metallopeptidase domain
MILVLASGSLAPALQAVGWALLHLVWQGAAIAAALALVLAMLPSRSANARYAFSCAALALVVVAGVWTGVREYRASVPSARLASAAPAGAVATHRAAPALVSTAAPSVAAMVLATYVPAPPRSLRDPMRAASDALPWVVSLWLAGVVVLSLRLIVQWLRAQRLVTVSAQPACEPWLAMAHRLGRALGVRQAVRLFESTAVQVPAVVGLLKPVILLPANTLTGLLPGQLEMILAHELAHIRRHDFLVNLLQATVETLLFYHPAVWWISRQVRIERENCCDDLAVAVCGSPLQYARALTRLEELRAESLAFALSARGGSLLHRIRRLVGGPGAGAPAGPVRGVTALALLIGLALAFAGPSLTAIAKPQAASQARPRPVAGAAAMAEPVSKPCPAVATLHAGDDGKCPDAIDDGDSNDGEDSASAADDAAAPDAGEDPGEDASDGTSYAPNSTEAIAHGHIRLTVDELIALRSAGVTTADILEMRSLFPAVEIHDIAGMYAVGATPDYVRRLNAAGVVARTPEEAKSMAAVGVTPEFLADMRDAGIPVKNAKVACALAAVGVTSDYVRGMRAAGLSIATADDAKGLAAVGVTPDFVQGMRSAGLRLAGVDDAKSLAAVGVTPDYVRDMRAYGVPIRDANDAKSLAAVGVRPEFVRRLARAGYTNLSVQELCRLGAGGITDDFIDEMAKYRTH